MSTEIGSIRDIRNTQSFAELVRSDIEKIVLKYKVKHFIANVEKSTNFSCTLHSGVRHSKSPDASNSKLTTSIFAVMENNTCGECEVISEDPQEVARIFEKRVSQFESLKHFTIPAAHTNYPKVSFTSAMLRAIPKDARLQEAIKLCKSIDAKAKALAHSRLMSREVCAAISFSERIYFDSCKNFASEDSSSVYSSISYALSDTSESGADLTSGIPSEKEIAKLYEMSSRNLIESEVHELGACDDRAIVLTPFAFLTLLEDLVLPNLQIQAILKGVGAWEVGHLGKKVLPRLTIHDNPLQENSPFSTLFDREGTPSQPVTVMKNGVLQNPLLTIASLNEIAQSFPELKEKFTLSGHAVSSNDADFTNVTFSLHELNSNALDSNALNSNELNLNKLNSSEIMTPLSQESVLANSKQVIVVSNLTGMTVEPLTGQFTLDSDGAKVFENGNLAYSTSLTLRGNINEILE